MPDGDDSVPVLRPGLQTRASNAKKHPGRVITDQIRHRRSHSEVVADRIAAEEAQAIEAKEQLERIQAVALIRHRLEQEMNSVSYRVSDVTSVSNSNMPMPILIGKDTSSNE